MIGVDQIGQIRRAFFERHLPIKQIVRTLSVSRATVRKVIRGKATAFSYQRGVQPAPKLREWVEVLTEILEKAAELPRRERRSTRRLYEELRGHGYDGAHDSVHRFTKAWRNERAGVPVQALVPLSFAPGEAYPFDWSHETITLQGLPLTIKAAHMKLSHSRCRLCAPASARPRNWCSTPSLAFHRRCRWNLGQLRPRQGVPVLRRGLPARPRRPAEPGEGTAPVRRE